MSKNEDYWYQSAINLIIWLLSRLGIVFDGEKSPPSNSGFSSIVVSLMLVSLITFILIMFVRLFGGG
ncbi:hypothetical protein [Shewanella fidelis]|uniref:DUF2970 domain-containing protein n=1 Tax=Shewanella fidelis TaxID=173509 RepID=A0AAW8NNC3_9GAMM|nr:hypothetical protein [Shewanella fidelis]MDR8523850.1 hypothetical protein [Shewanella fidelis]MDW4810398.1 hypothetical protein [Shewanella fidelis]MDW4823715.1 hypothetical protein [Shewanella fidelis]